MRYAIASDIHANLPAWSAVLADISDLEIDHIINLGDIVGYGPSPSEVVASVRANAAVSVIGNHDAVCANLLDPSIFNEHAREVINWTSNQLDENDVEFLANMPETVRPEASGFLLTHAEVISPFNFGYILNEQDASTNFAACEDSLIFIGHTHHAGVFMQGAEGKVTIHKPKKFKCDPEMRYIINPGSVGDPRSPEIVASYCIYDSDANTVEFRKVEFDVDAYRELFSASGLTSKPYFISYLDDLSTNSSKVEMVFPHVGDSDQTAKALAVGGDTHKSTIDFRGTLQVGKSAKKSNWALISVLLFLLIGCGSLAWLTLRKSPENAEIAEREKAKETKSELVMKLTIKPVTGRYIRISNPNIESLSLNEVEVISTGNSIAVDKKIIPSTPLNPSKKALESADKNHAKNHGKPNLKTAAKRPIWWEVDLGKDNSINEIAIHNSSKDAKQMKQLDGFTLEIFNDKRELVYQRLSTTLRRHLEALGINYKRAKFHDVASWNDTMLLEDNKTVDWKFDVTDKLTEGNNTFTFQYTEGDIGLDILEVKLLKNGKVISKDKHHGFTGSIDTRNTYNLTVKKQDANATYTLIAKVAGSEEIDSFGTINLQNVEFKTLQNLPYQ